MITLLLSFDFFRDGAVVVFSGIASLAPPDDQDDFTDQRDEAEEKQPTTLVDVVQTTSSNTEGGEQHCEHPHVGDVHANFAEQTQNEGDDEVEQEGIPEFFTVGTS